MCDYDFLFRRSDLSYTCQDVETNFLQLSKFYYFFLNDFERLLRTITDVDTFKVKKWNPIKSYLHNQRLKTF